jgi:CBS domain-containing protein
VPTNDESTSIDDRLNNTTAGKIMQTRVTTVSPELPITTFQEFLTGEEISGAPVVDEDGVLHGVASKTDIVTFLTNEPTFLSDEVMQGVTVGEIMTPGVLTVGVDENVREVARRMVSENVHRVLVVDGGEIQGILTTLDVLKVLV